MLKTFAAWVLFFALVLAAPAAGQRRVRLSPALALARICVSEAGWECWDTGDGVAIHEVLLRGAERHAMTYSTFARTYSPRAVGDRPGRLRPWIGSLNEAGDAPFSWPRITTHRRRDGMVAVEPHPPWSAYRERWLAVLAQAREVIGWTLDDVDEWGLCEGEVHDWGGAMDRARAERIGLIPIDCGETRNDFYARPSLVQDEPAPVSEVENLEPLAD
jgi:hypothetical protein